MKALIACFVILTSLSASIEIAADAHVNVSGEDLSISDLLDGSCPGNAPAGMLNGIVLVSFINEQPSPGLPSARP